MNSDVNYGNELIIIYDYCKRAPHKCKMLINRERQWEEFEVICESVLPTQFFCKSETARQIKSSI